MRVARRDFVRSLLGGVVGLPALGGRDVAAPAAPDPRLTARPRRPFRPPEVGVTRLAPDRERGALLYVPPTYDPASPAPLLVALHGAGGFAGSWSHLFPLCEEHTIVMLAPDSRGRTWDRAVTDFGPDVGFVDATLRYTFERCAIDRTHVALAGFSDGASYALSLGPSNGDLFSHLVAWSPGFSDPADPIVGAPRVFVSHGTRDRVLPVDLSRHAIVPTLEMDGYEVEYVEFDGRHEMPPSVVARTMEWFLG